MVLLSGSVTLAADPECMADIAPATAVRVVVVVYSQLSKTNEEVTMETINVSEAPGAIGPYCHAMKSGNLVFCSGQTPLDPDTMTLAGSTIEEQTARVLQNLSIVLEGLNLTLKNVVKTTVYLKDMAHFKGMNAIYEEMFDGHKPSRTTIAVKQNPLDALVEIECVAELA